MKYHDAHVRDIRVRRLQCDEIWAYIGAKAKNVNAAKKEIGWGDVWTWVGIDADTKLVISYLIGGRGADWAMDFMQDCASRIRGRVQITTDGHRAYLEAVEGMNSLSQGERLRVVAALVEGNSIRSTSRMTGIARNTLSPGFFDGDPRNLTREQSGVVDKVLAFYGPKDPQWLSGLTHLESPWKDARQGMAPDERGNRVISKAAMSEYYSACLWYGC